MAKKPTSDLVGLLRRMWLIRAFEEKASALYAERQIVGLLHLGIGQEAVAVGVCSLLTKDDLVYGGHRSHGHAIAKGADINRLMAELAGRATGYCGGKGGSMHIVAKEGIEVEVVDPRTLVHFDLATILTSVEKTHRVVIADETHQSCGVGAEIAARIAETGFDKLKTGIRRVSTLDVPVPYSPPLEAHIGPSESRIIDAVKAAMA